MTQVLLWVQHLPVFVSIAEADSVWAYPTVLMLHTVGLGWLVGLNTVVNLRLLGVGRRVPFGSFEKLFPMMWWGFWLNLATGIILFCIDADHKGHRNQEGEQKISHYSATISMCLLPAFSSNLRVSVSEYLGSLVSITM